MNTPSKLTQEELHQKVIDCLEENGGMPDREWKKLLLMIVGDTWEHVRVLSCLPKRIETLENNSILIQAKKSKGTATLWLVGVSLFFYTLHDILPWLVSRVNEITQVIK